MKISVCIPTKNAAATLSDTLCSLEGFAEVLVLDNGSEDATLEIAASFPHVAIHRAPFCGFGPLRNQAAALARYDWIFALDSDEQISPSLREELRQLQLDESHAYAVERHNHYNGKRIRGCGWGGDWVVRLYHRKRARFNDAQVHESLQTGDVAVQKLQNPLIHTPYRTTADFLAKMQHYSTLFAQQYQHRKKASLPIALSHAAFAFFKSYALKRGWRDGGEGLIISLYNASTTLYKYLKLAECNRLVDGNRGSP